MFDNMSEEKRALVIKTLNELSENAKKQAIELREIRELMFRMIEEDKKKVAENASK